MTLNYHTGEPDHLGQAQPAQQKPVAHLWQHGETKRTSVWQHGDVLTANPLWHYIGPLYLHPVQRLSDEAVRKLVIDYWGTLPPAVLMTAEIEFVRAIEAAHGITQKGTT